MFWDLQEQPDGTYVGKYWEPYRGRTLDTRIKVQGNDLQLETCDENGCENVIWTRLK